MSARITGAKRGLAVFAGLIATGVFATSAEGAVLASSSFETGAEGWKVVGDTSSGTEAPTHFPSGGNPNGYIAIDDAATGGVMYWRAPASIRRTADGAFAGSLLFSLQQSANTNQFNTSDVLLEGAGLTLVYDLASNPPLTPDWGTYNVKLTKAGWTDQSAAAPATNGDMKDVLEDLDALLIRAEYQTGPDTDGLDTVSVRSKPAQG